MIPLLAREFAVIAVLCTILAAGCSGDDKPGGGSDPDVATDSTGADSDAAAKDDVSVDAVAAGDSDGGDGSCADLGTCDCKTDQDCAPFEDGNACNGTLFCDLGGDSPGCRVKPSTIVTCDDSLDTACVKTGCQPADGSCKAQPLMDGTACEDNEACTKPDACQSGVCTGPSTCSCEKDADCDAFDDGDVCNGKLYCAGAGTPQASCKVNPGTVVNCPKDGDGVCNASQCNPQTGSCALGPLKDGAACDVDGSSCSLDACKGGACLAGPLADPCACEVDADCGPFDDGNACNGTLYCSKAVGHCVLNAASIVHCPNAADTACLRNVCSPATGLCKFTPEPKGSPCDDGWDCSSNESCAQGQCIPSKGECTCQKTADCDAYAASNACAKLYCDKPSGICKPNPATFKLCDPLGDPACSVTACDTKTGKCQVKPINEGGPCEADGTWCTNLDVCAAGVCKAAASQCPCKADGDCVQFDDGDLCNGTLYCDKPSGQCLPNPVSLKTCSGAGDGPCKPLACDPKDGACKPTALPDGATCDTDGSPCTAQACSGGSCTDLGSACPCWENADCAAAEDGDLCNGTLFCNKAANPPICELNPATVVTCAVSGSVCSNNACDPSSGACKSKAVDAGVSCDDGDVCTGPDACAGGICGAGPQKVCSDGDPCTLDACDPKAGCTYGAVVVGTDCDDGDACTEGESCKAGGCKGGTPVDCADSDLCTVDSCASATGCQHVSTEGAPCPGGVCGAVGCVAANKGGAAALGRDVGFAEIDGFNVGWGHNVDGMLPAPQATGLGPHPPKQMAITSLRALAVSNARACGINPLGELHCWGSDDAGVPVPPTKVASTVAMAGIAARRNQTFLIDAAGQIWTMAAAKKTDLTKLVTPPKAGGKFIQVAAGAAFGCALQDDKSVYCWGANDVGQLGQGAGKAVGGTTASQPLQVTLPPTVEICTGDDFGCALDGSGIVRCWGQNARGQAGSGVVAAVQWSPLVVKGTDLPLPAPFAAKTLRCGAAHACVTTATGVACWGANDVGQLGDGTGVDQITPAVVKDATNAPLVPGLSTLAIGDATSCLVDNKNLRCWGDDSTGLLGTWLAGTSSDAQIPAPVLRDDGTKLKGAQALAGTDGGFCARLPVDPVDLESDPRWYCWGNVRGGILPEIASSPTNLPAATLVPALNAIWTLDTGAHEACVQDPDNGVFSCQGRNAAGATLGVPGTAVTSMTKVANLPAFANVARSSTHACGAENAKAYCWGQGTSGQLGDGKGLTSGVVAVSGLSDVYQVYVAAGISCGTDATLGKTFCWGDNTLGRVGSGTSGGTVKVPTQIAGGHGFTFLDVSATHACGVEGVGVWCWGYNGGAENVLGAKVAAQSGATPVAVVGLGGTAQPQIDRVYVGPKISCAVESNGTTHCWGANTDGQLGQGHSLFIPAAQQPLKPKGTPKLDSLRFGNGATCGLVDGSDPAEGEVWCWGSRYGGQVGRKVGFTPKATTRSMPVVGT